MPLIIRPPYSVLIVSRKGEELAADSGSQDIVVIKAKDRDSNRQHARILPDGKIMINGRYTKSNSYDSEVGLTNSADAAEVWLVEGKGKKTIRHPKKTQLYWTYGDVDKPLELAEKDSSKRQEFVLPRAPPTADKPPPDDPAVIEDVSEPEKFLILGAPRDPDSVQDSPPVRLEINDFIKDEKFFSLYVQALLAFYDTPETEMLSFYQVAGVHGFPLVHWNQSREGGGSYCRHQSVLFPTWHRPFVALFEQIIHLHAAQIAATYETDTEEWERAAENLRQPFWDWAKEGGSVPPPILISQETVKITRPDGEIQWVDNPFLRYRFKTKAAIAAFPKEFASWPVTYRHPYAKEPVKQIKAWLAKAQEKLTANTHRLFSIDNWDEFSNKSKTSLGATNSLEALHDTIHVLAGRNGHFSSSCGGKPFDPLFFLHHSQVDRLLSLWAAVHEKVWVGEDEINTNLTPFWNAETSYWSSATTRAPEILNYTYPEFQNVKGDLRAHIAKVTHNLYGGPDIKAFPGFYAHRGIGAQGHEAWSVRIRAKPFELDSSFSIAVFLGKVPDDPSEWFTDPSLVGSHDVFISYDPSVCENCRSHENVPLEGFIHLNTALESALGHLDDKNPEVVKQYLKDNLYFGVQKVDGSVVNLESLEVEVVSRPLTLLRGTKFLSHGQPEIHRGISIKPQETYHRI